MSKARIYLVSGNNGENRLVRATTRHQSIMHVASAAYTSQVASQEDLVESLQSGMQIENYKDFDQQELELSEN